MAFIDEIQVHMKAGKGGDGVVRWRHEKGKDKAGAAGGNGGRGGDVYVRGVRSFHILSNYKHVKEFAAKNGGDGFRDSMHGKYGDDLIVDFPIGSTIKNLSTEKVITLLEDGETVMVLKGGKGGLGNEHFKASTNVRPMQKTLGKEGEEADFLIELALVADAGLVGLPNAGKSSLLNELTNAAAKVGSYAFTTLEPNLGAFYGYVLADIPGLIAGASEGRGLGHKFLRHITRTSLILHCVSAENEDVADAYKTIRNELKSYGTELVQKPEIVLLTKTDTVSEKDLIKKKKALEKLCDEVISVSVLDDKSIKALSQLLVKQLSKKAEKADKADKPEKDQKSAGKKTAK
jgi:GTP-binding protein